MVNVPDMRPLYSPLALDDQVITLDAGHASLASRPGEVAALIDEAAKATG